MSEELIKFVISFSITFIITFVSTIVGIYIAKITSLKSISKDELNYKTFEWYMWTVHYDLSSYNWLSRKRILKNYREFIEYFNKRNQKAKEEKRKQKDLYF